MLPFMPAMPWHPHSGGASAPCQPPPAHPPARRAIGFPSLRQCSRLDPRSAAWGFSRRPVLEIGGIPDSDAPFHHAWCLPSAVNVRGYFASAVNTTTPQQCGPRHCNVYCDAGPAPCRAGASAFKHLGHSTNTSVAAAILCLDTRLMPQPHTGSSTATLWQVVMCIPQPPSNDGDCDM